MTVATYDACQVSACLLNYNHAHVLESTVDSILTQDCAGFELVISDDCSTDGSWECIQTLAKRDSRIIPLRTRRNLGMPGNANFAIAQSARPYIALLHHDDICRSDLIRCWAQCMDDHPEVGYVFNAYGVHGSNVLCTHPFDDGALQGQWFLKRFLFPRWGCPVRGTAMIRRDCWDAVGGMDDRFNLLADVDLWMKLAAQYDVGYISEPLLSIRQDRPDDYPDTYLGSGGGFWLRRQFLYRIHSANRRATYSGRSLVDLYSWLFFRARLSSETLKWLCYAAVRRRHDLLATSHLGAVPEEFLFVGWLRRLLVKLYAPKQRSL
jgi:glycosyltransferase involved in cell wall biosynthesis